MNRKEFTNLLLEWRKNFVNEASKVSFSSPEDFVGDKKGIDSSKIQSRHMERNIEDMTHLSVEDTLKKLINLADENVFIHFITKSNKLSNDKISDERKKTLSVNPNVNWGDQQGIFSYRLNKQNLVNLIQTGKPTSASFGAGSSLFQIFKIDDARMIEISEKEGSAIVKLPTSLLPVSNRSLEKNLETLIKESFYLITSSNVKDLDSHYISDSIKKIVELYLEAKNSKNFNVYIPEIKQAIKKLTKEQLTSFYEGTYSYYLKHIETRFFLILKSYISLISKTLSFINNTTGAQYGSLLWHLLGVENINDKGTGLIHRNEMSQAVSFDFTGKSLSPIGTFKNYFNERPLGKHYEKFLDIISDENVNWDLNVVTKKFDSISDSREWDLEYLKKMLKIYKPDDIKKSDDIRYYWCDTMEGVLWSFSEHKNPDIGLLLLKYVIDNVPILKEQATYYYNELKEEIENFKS